MNRVVAGAALIQACLLPTMLAHCAMGQLSSPVTSICTVTSDAANYDGKEVTIQGLWRMVVHGSILMGSGCPDVEVNITESNGYKANKRALSLMRALAKKDRFAPAEVVLRGKFRLAHQGQCFGQICARYEIETDELISAKAPPPTSSPVPSKHSSGAANQEHRGYLSAAEGSLLHESGHVGPLKP